MPGIGTILAAFKLNPSKYVMYAIGVVFFLAIIVGIVYSYEQHRKQHDTVLVNQGALTERVQSQGETINAVQTAKAAVEHPTADQLNIVCSTYDRNCPHRP